MSDKRDIRRHKKRYSLRFGIDSPTRLAFTEDISSHGLFIKTTNICSVGTRILVDLTLPNNETVSIEGVVRWSKKVPPHMIHKVSKSGMGIKISRVIAGETAYRHLIYEIHAREASFEGNKKEVIFAA